MNAEEWQRSAAANKLLSDLIIVITGEEICPQQITLCIHMNEWRFPPKAPRYWETAIRTSVSDLYVNVNVFLKKI
jgi:hypothetical protein